MVDPESRTDFEIAVESVIGRCLGVSAGEEVLVVCNPATEQIGGALREAAEACGADAVLAVISERDTHAAEPPGTVAAAMSSADAVLAPTVQSLSHTAARKSATGRGARIATLPGVTAGMLARVMSADMARLAQRGRDLAAKLTDSDLARVRCPRGSDLTLGLSGRQAIADDGDLAAAGAFGNLPCGEGFIAPVEGTASGRLVVDGSIAGVGLLSEPVELEVSEGHLVSAGGDAGSRLLELLSGHGDGGTNVAELGIGTNEKAILTGNILEDEKILGTCHVAFGASAAIGGTVQVPVHLDCVVMRPEVLIGDEVVAHDGELLV